MKHSLIRSMLLLLLCLSASQQASANGGQIRISNEPVGPYVVTVYTAPSPLRAGPVDVSVAVLDGQDLTPAQDVQVTVITEPIGHAGAGGSFPATTEQATNRLFYAAKFTLPSDGQWRMIVDIASPQGGGSTSFEVDAGAASPISGPWLFVLLAVVPLAIAWWMAQAQRERLRPQSHHGQERS